MNEKRLLKRIASKLPVRWQQQLRHLYSVRQIKTGRFLSDVPEFNQFGQWLTEGDWVLDIGANVGNYVIQFSKMVGKKGRVIAVEPVPETFELLAANVVALLSDKNVTLLNIAASDTSTAKGIRIPKFDTGWKNYYEAHLTDNNPDFNVLCLPIDSLNIPHRIKLVKIDAEGHDYSVLKGMKNLLQRDYPTLIIENGSSEVISFLKERGYSYKKNEGSQNFIFQYSQMPEKLKAS